MLVVVSSDGSCTLVRRGFSTMLVGRHLYQYKINKTTVTIYNPLGQKDMPRKTELSPTGSVAECDIEKYVKATQFTVAKVS